MSSQQKWKQPLKPSSSSSRPVAIQLRGGEAIGKSTLIQRLRLEVEGVVAAAHGTGATSPSTNFAAQMRAKRLDPTVEDRYTVTLPVSSTLLQTQELSILDTGGSDDQEALRPAWDKFGDVAVVCFAVDDRDSFVLARKLVEHLHAQRTKSKRRRFASLRAGLAASSQASKAKGEGKAFPIILCGTKADVPDSQRVVSQRDAEAACRTLDGAAYCETSALADGGSVRDLFEMCVSVTGRKSAQRRALWSSRDGSSQNAKEAARAAAASAFDTVRAASAAAAAAAASGNAKITDETVVLRNCPRCSEYVEHGQGIGRGEDNIWHNKCFSCYHCGKAFESNKFAMRGTTLLHLECRAAWKPAAATTKTGPLPPLPTSPPRNAPATVVDGMQKVFKDLEDGIDDDDASDYLDLEEELAQFAKAKVEDDQQIESRLTFLERSLELQDSSDEEGESLLSGKATPDSRNSVRGIESLIQVKREQQRHFVEIEDYESAMELKSEIADLQRQVDEIRALKEKERLSRAQRDEPLQQAPPPEEDTALSRVQRRVLALRAEIRHKSESVKFFTVNGEPDEAAKLEEEVDDLKAELAEADQLLANFMSTAPKALEYDESHIEACRKIQHCVRGFLARVMLARRKRMHDRRGRVAGELLQSEVVYVNAVREIVEVYLKPLRALAGTSDPPMSHDDLKTVFGDIEGILEASIDLRQRLNGRLTNFQPHTRVGDILLEFASAPMLVYMAYIRNYSLALERMSLGHGTSAAGAAFRQWLELNTRVSDGDPTMQVAAENSKLRHLKHAQSVSHLESLLIRPVQRIPRYALLLKDLKKATWETHNDYPDICAALDQVEAVAHMINEKKRESENRRRVFELQLALFGQSRENKGKGVGDSAVGSKQTRHINLLAPNRVFVREGECLLAFGAQSRDAPVLRTVFLFSDILLVAKRQMGRKRAFTLGTGSREGEKPAEKFKLEVICDLNGAKVIDTASRSASSDQRMFTFEVLRDDLDIMFAFESMAEQQHWYRSVSSCHEKFQQSMDLIDRQSDRVARERAKTAKALIDRRYQNLKLQTLQEDTGLVAEEEVTASLAPKPGMRKFTAHKTSQAENVSQRAAAAAEAELVKETMDVIEQQKEERARVRAAQATALLTEQYSKNSPSTTNDDAKGLDSQVGSDSAPPKRSLPTPPGRAGTSTQPSLRKFGEIAEREATFKTEIDGRRYPHSIPSGQVLAAAGFYYAPTATRPDGVTCFSCHQRLHSFTPQDDPRAAHRRANPECVVVRSWGSSAGIERAPIGQSSPKGAPPKVSPRPIPKTPPKVSPRPPPKADPEEKYPSAQESPSAPESEPPKPSAKRAVAGHLPKSAFGRMKVSAEAAAKAAPKKPMIWGVAEADHESQKREFNGLPELSLKKNERLVVLSDPENPPEFVEIRLWSGGHGVAPRELVRILGQ